MKKFKKNQKAVRVYKIDTDFRSYDVFIEYGIVISAGKKQIKFEGEWYTNKFDVERFGQQFFALEDLNAAKQYKEQLIKELKESDIFTYKPKK